MNGGKRDHSFIANSNYATGSLRGQGFKYQDFNRKTHVHNSPSGSSFLLAVAPAGHHTKNKIDDSSCIKDAINTEHLVCPSFHMRNWRGRKYKACKKRDSEVSAKNIWHAILK